MNTKELKVMRDELNMLFDKLINAGEIERLAIMMRISNINNEISEDLKQLREKSKLIGATDHTIKIDGSGLEPKLAEFMFDILY